MCTKVEKASKVQNYFDSLAKDKPKKEFTFKQILEENWANYLQNTKKFVNSDQLKAVNKILACRTPLLGEDYYNCGNCESQQIIAYNCKHRFCSNCGWTDTIRWADRLVGSMIDMPHRHIVVTLPHCFNKLVFHNKEALLNLFLKTSAQALKVVVYDLFKVKIGIASVLHTFGEKKNVHIHAHMIMTWGGLTVNRKVLQLDKTQRIDYNLIKDTFKKLFITGLIELQKNNDIKTDFESRDEFIDFLNLQDQKKWIVNLDEPMPNPFALVKYIGRYSKRACISDYKIKSYDGKTVGLKYKDYKETDKDGKPVEKILHLSVEDFIFRVLQHVPLKRFKVVRYYGIYANRKAIDKNELFKHKDEYNQNKKSEVYTFTDRDICKKCGGKLEYLYSLTIKKTIELNEPISLNQFYQRDFLTQKSA